MIPGGVIHVDDRNGDPWPLPAGFRNKWTGWLTYQEYNIIECNNRRDINNMYTIAKRFGVADTTGERIFHHLFNAGILTGAVECFQVTPMAKILFDMTDQYILEMQLDDEDHDEPGLSDRPAS